MGIVLQVKHTDMALPICYRDFNTFRNTIAKTAGKPFLNLYESMIDPAVSLLSNEEKKIFLSECCQKVIQMVKNGSVSSAVIKFCCQPDTYGRVTAMDCAEILELGQNTTVSNKFGYKAVFDDVCYMLKEAVQKNAELIWGQPADMPA